MALTKRALENKELLKDPKIQATLTMIRRGEGTLGDKGYTTRFGGGQISDLSDHPGGVVTAGGYTSSAAGAYQFLGKTWKPLQSKLGLEDFSRESQDIAAVELLRQRGALKHIAAGDVKATLNSIAPEWASMPMTNGKSRYGQPVVKQEVLAGIYNDVLAGKPIGDSNYLQAIAQSGGTPAAATTVANRGSVENVDTQTVEERMASVFGITSTYITG